jgi:hypothetical protein
MISDGLLFRRVSNRFYVAYLVVEPTVRKINGIGTGGVVGAADDLADVEASGIGFDGIFKGVQIFSRYKPRTESEA